MTKLLKKMDVEDAINLIEEYIPIKEELDKLKDISYEDCKNKSSYYWIDYISLDLNEEINNYGKALKIISQPGK